MASRPTPASEPATSGKISERIASLTPSNGRVAAYAANGSATPSPAEMAKRGLESSGLDLFFGETLRAGIHKVAGYGEQADSSERAGDKRQDIGANRLVDSIERQSRGICGQRQRHAQPR